MNPEPDPIEARLRALRPLTWQRDDHRHRLEIELMQASRNGASRRPRSWLARLGIVGGLVLAGGAAGAATMALVDRWTITELDLPGDQKLVGITDHQTGQTQLTTVPDETEFFEMQDEQGEDMLLGLTPIDGDPPDGQ